LPRSFPCHHPFFSQILVSTQNLHTTPGRLPSLPQHLYLRLEHLKPRGSPHALSWRSPPKCSTVMKVSDNLVNPNRCSFFVKLSNSDSPHIARARRSHDMVRIHSTTVKSEPEIHVQIN
jgi:hypothetical protein